MYYGEKPYDQFAHASEVLVANHLVYMPLNYWEFEGFQLGIFLIRPLFHCEFAEHAQTLHGSLIFL